MIGKLKINIKVIISVLFIIIFGVFFMLKFNVVNEKEQKLELDTNLKEMGKNFYIKHYYNQISFGRKQSDITVFLKNFSTIGIKVTLNNLEKYDASNNKEFINRKTGKICNKNTSFVIIYPKEPYGENDFAIEVTLDCGFDDK
jgi:hypothetical protein